MAQAATSRVVRFGLFELDLDARELRKSGVRIKLQEQPFQILAMLVGRPGAIVTRDELQRTLWPGDTFVDFDLSLNSAVKKLRQALNDDSENPRFVETLYRRGYRFIAPVSGAPNPEQIPLVEIGSLSAASAEPMSSRAASDVSTRRKRSIFYLAILLLLFIVGAAAYWLAPSRQPTILGYTQITHDARGKGLVSTDAERLYFAELQGDRAVASQVSVAGGETSVLATPFENAGPFSVAPNGSALLLGVFRYTAQGMELWSLPLPSGAARRLGDFVIDSATWSPDGCRLSAARFLGFVFHPMAGDFASMWSIREMAPAQFGKCVVMEPICIHYSPVGTVTLVNVAATGLPMGSTSFFRAFEMVGPVCGPWPRNQLGSVENPNLCS